ncbi:hypothetical protein FOLKNPGA_02846 [Legionella sp. PC1000]|uniref:Uncharacterized protein n=1 Tax=Legionella resiliens TaxID=2905958 RepID=A0A977P1X1_9GAMM|nr:hypothetical protein [Legionella sp. PC1000]QLZ70042.1 hypothetical protein FOLKNPGA_02846 [Legionella sp. PC1000]UWX38853.1 hypothetical protein LXO92_p00019 [Legionella sp. 8cVS16]
MPNPFFVFLKKKHTVKKFTSYQNTEQTNELQLLVASGNKAQYRKREQELNEEGYKFRLTKGVVYEIRDEGEKINVRVAVQVKGFSLTWYFWAPDGMDQYPQDFRDKLYNAAAKAHKEVEDGCDLYLRGSDDLHGKLMHHLPLEFGHNHNHYRLKNNKAYTPKDFNQHMVALAKTEIYQEFFEEGEIDEICKKFEQFYLGWVAKEGAKPSLEEEYFSSPSQKLELEDVIELELFAHQQEPCRINMTELKVDYQAARKEIERIVREGLTTESLSALLEKVDNEYNEFVAFRSTGGSRGLTPEITDPSKIKGTRYLAKTPGMGRDDKLKKELPDVPKWAHSVQSAIDKARAFMLEDARKRLAGTLPISGSIGEGLEKVSPKEPEKATPKAKEPERDKQEVVEVLGTHGNSFDPKVKASEVVLSIHASTTFLGQLQKENESTQQKGRTDVQSIFTI